MTSRALTGAPSRKPRTIRQQTLMVLLGLNLLIMPLFTGVLYASRKQSLLADIDNRMRTIAVLARELLPSDYHDRISGPDSISDSEFERTVDRYNRICVALDIEYIWSLMSLDGKIVFTTSTSPDKVVGNRKHARFFEAHSNPEFYTSTFERMKPVYTSIHDKWGHIRVVLIPAYDAQGRKFLFGAACRIAEVDRLLHDIVWQTLFVGVALFVLSVAVGSWFTHLLTLPINRLTATIQRIAAGENSIVAAEQGSYEQVVLAHQFNLMNSMLKEKISELELAHARLIELCKTERKQAEDDLVLSARRYRELLNLAVDGILIGSHEGVITDVNECMCGLFGLQREEVVGKHIGQMPFAPQSLKETPFRFDLLYNGETVVSERTIARPDGSAVMVEIRSKMMPDGILQSIYRNITERKKALAQLEALNATLEQRVAERTSEVQKYADQLRALTGRLIQVEETERQRIAHTLHEDLQQVLVAARMTVGVALEGSRGSSSQSQLERVDGMLSQAIQLTRTLVQEIAVPAMNERDLPSSVRWLAQQMLEKFGLIVVVQTCDGDVGEMGEEIYLCLYRAVQELLFNIVKHAKVKHAEVIIEKGKGRSVQVTVRDGGIGFSEDALTGSDKHGVGFGLFGIRERLEGLGGRLDLVSATGQGVSVILTAPLGDGEKDSKGQYENSSL